MKQITLLSYILMVFCYQAWCQKNETQYYKSGKLKMEVEYNPNTGLGQTIEYYESGQMLSKKSYKQGKLNGDDILYFPDGQIQLYYFWKDGTPENRIYGNHKNGKLSFESYFADGFKTGHWKFYDQNGYIIKEQIFESKKTLWNSDLDYMKELHYLDNKLAYILTYELGKVVDKKIINQELFDRLFATKPPLGQTLFLSNCARCHSASIDLVGPKLKGVTKTRTTDWLKKMITNGEQLRKSGDKTAVGLYSKWNNLEHPNFEKLDSEEIESIIDYLKTFN